VFLETPLRTVAITGFPLPKVLELTAKFWKNTAFGQLWSDFPYFWGYFRGLIKHRTSSPLVGFLCEHGLSIEQ
jgi:hypothetical protein